MVFSALKCERAGEYGKRKKNAVINPGTVGVVYRRLVLNNQTHGCAWFAIL
jgi:hypothetical protein